MPNIVYLTSKGLKKLRDEVEFLKAKERPRISKQIAEARDKGDLSENAEYDAAKEAQGMLELKIAKLEEKLSNSRVIDENQLSKDKVLILSKVELLDKNKNKKAIYTLVPENEVNLAEKKISINTPIAKGLLGKKVGDVVKISLPNSREVIFEIIKIY